MTFFPLSSTKCSENICLEKQKGNKRNIRDSFLVVGEGSGGAGATVGAGAGEENIC